MRELGEEAAAWLTREGIAPSQQRVSYHADMRYRRQGYELAIAVELGELEDRGAGVLAQRFDALHERLYGFRLEAVCEIVNLRSVAQGKVREIALPEAEPDGPASAHAQVDVHTIYFDGKFLDTAIFERARLRPGNGLSGPAIITEMDSTTVVLPGFHAEVDRYFNLIVRPQG